MVRSASPRAVVTGASGFIGGALCRRLIADGVAVTAIARRQGPEAPGLTWTCMDLRDGQPLEPVLEGAIANSLTLPPRAR